MGMSARMKEKKGRFGDSGLDPVIRVTSDLSGSTETNAVAFTATATATDNQLVGSPVASGDVSAYLVWTSDLDGQVGTGGSPSITLTTVGTHVITVSITAGSPTGNTSQTHTVYVV